MNSNRGGTAAGDAQSGQIWSETLPRKLIPVPTDRQVLRDPQPQKPGLPRARTPARQTTATARTQAQPSAGRYVRVATYRTDADARASAKALARQTGLTVRLGTLKSKGKTYRVVLAGPFPTTPGANAALAKVKQAGYSGARLSK